MTQTPAQHLGGRIPLLDPTKLEPEQKELYDRINGQFGPRAEAAGFESKTSDGQADRSLQPGFVEPKHQR
jgi:hypothetical protein